MVTRRDVLKGTLATAAGLAAAGCGSTDTNTNVLTAPLIENVQNGRRPNILFMLVDQMRLPPTGYGPDEGEVKDVKELLGFAPTISPTNQYASKFEFFNRLRKNAVVLRKHYIAAAACAPSRTTMMTGQYPSLHGVDQVNGIFKEATEIQFLDPQGVPTIGDWFEAAGYHAYYFGKWHVSDVPPPYDLTDFGFRGYETSGPEPHGSNPNNLGVYRDPGFADIVSGFLEGQDPKSEQPWFAVASLVNPHDIAAYPVPFYGPQGQSITVAVGTPPFTSPQEVPFQGQETLPDTSGNIVDLNPDGFFQDCFNLPPGYQEDLRTKPRCQYDQAIKVQVSLRAQFPRPAGILSPFPLQENSQYVDWLKHYGQFYVYLQHLVDLELRRILDSLDATGHRDNTIIIFSSDHGEYAGCHGTMIQKWHTGYEEATHVPLIVSSPLVNSSENTMLEVNVPTSHVDLAPTFLGLAGFNSNDLASIKEKLAASHTQVRDFVGNDLTQAVLNGKPPARSGVLFTTDDRITELPDGVAAPEKQSQYTTFLQDIEVLKIKHLPLDSGPVLQPNSVRSFVDGEWKLNRYLDPRGKESDEWEMYHLVTDPNELINLVNYADGSLRSGVSVHGFTDLELEAKRVELMKNLAEREATLLLKPI